MDGQVILKAAGRERARRRGAAVVELAVALPILLLILLGLIEFGRAMMVEQTLINASRSGCRRAVLEAGTRQDVLDMVDAVATASRVSDYTVTMTPDPPSAADPGDAVTVTVEVAFDDVSLLPVPQFLSGATLSGSTVLPREGSE